MRIAGNLRLVEQESIEVLFEEFSDDEADFEIKAKGKGNCVRNGMQDQSFI